MQIELWPIGVAQCLRFTMTSISKWEVPLCSNWIPLHWRIHRQFKQFDLTSESTCQSALLLQHQRNSFSSFPPVFLLRTARTSGSSRFRAKNWKFLLLQFSSSPPFSLSQTTSSTQGHGCNGQGSQGHDGHGHGGHDHGLLYPIADLFGPIWSSFIAVLTTVVIKSGVSFQRSILCSFMIARRQMWFLLIFFFPPPLPSLSPSLVADSLFTSRDSIYDICCFLRNAQKWCQHAST